MEEAQFADEGALDATPTQHPKLDVRVAVRIASARLIAPLARDVRCLPNVHAQQRDVVTEIARLLRLYVVNGSAKTEDSS